jgi:hypothetical protein
VGFMTKKRNEGLFDFVHDAHSRVFSASQKLQAFGVLLERQGENCEGYTDLHGLGMILSELSEELLQVWKDIDPGHLQYILMTQTKKANQQKKSPKNKKAVKAL